MALTDASMPSGEPVAAAPDAAATGEDVPLEEQIDILTWMLTAPAPDADPAEVTGWLADSRMELYARDGDPEQLELALDGYRYCVAAAPEHPQRLGWYFGMAMAHAERGVLRIDPDGHDRAIDGFTRLCRELPPDDPDRDEVVVNLMRTLWARFFDHRYGRPYDQATTSAELRATASAFNDLDVTGADPQAAGQVDLLRGLLHLATHDETAQRDDLDAGIGALARAIAALDPDTPWYAYAASELGNAYLTRANLDDRVTDLGLALDVCERALPYTGAGESDWMLLTSCQALAVQTRWFATGDSSDLDDAIAGWRRLLAAADDPWAAESCGYLLSQRAPLSGNVDDAVDAVRLLRYAADGARGSQAMVRWHRLGLAHHEHWRLTRLPEALDAAGECLDRALTLAVDADDLWLAVHNERLSCAYDRLSQDAELEGTGPPPSLSRYLGCLSDGREALDRAVDASAGLRAMSAGLLGLGEMYSGRFGLELVDLDRVQRMLAAGRAADGVGPDWYAQMDIGDGLLRYARDVQRPGGGDAGVTELIRAAMSTHLDADARGIVHGLLPIAVYGRSTQYGDIRQWRAALLLVEGGAEPESGTGLAAVEQQLLSHVIAMTELIGVGDLEAAFERIELAWAILERMPPSASTELTFLPIIRTLRQLMLIHRGEAGDDAVATDNRPLSAAQPPLALLAESIPIAQALTRGDIGGLRRAASRIGALCEQLPPDHVSRLMAALLAGGVELDIIRRVPWDRPAGRRAAGWYGMAADLGGPEHQMWSQMVLCRAEALRRSGDPDRHRTRQLGLAALHGYEWRVLLQSGTDDALVSAGEAAENALTVAGWCLEDGADEDAVIALDAGRGLVLQAAAMSRSIVDRLIDAGHPDLAAEWRDTSGRGRDQLTGIPLRAGMEDTGVPDDLRRRTMHVLRTGSPAEGSSPAISVVEIQAALATTGADALVYLMRAAAGRPGAAIIVPAVGPAHSVPLPGLTAEVPALVAGVPAAGVHAAGVPAAGVPAAGVPAAGVHAAGVLAPAGDACPAEPGVHRPGDEPEAPFYARPDGYSPERDAGVPGGSLRERSDVDSVCRWAWSAAVADLARHVRRWGLRRPARLVLVPMGTLALIPWHAAYSESSDRRWYAVREIVFSYSVSARMLCTVAAASTKPIDAALIVGDPRGDLPFAGIEARAIHDRFYPGGTYYGHSPTGAHDAGTPDDVLNWVAARSGSSLLLHLACHGQMDPRRPADAQLLLAGGTLAARSLLEVSRLAALVIERVFLASCTTHVTGTNHDEVFSLATTFLAAGAHTVFGSMWPVPDAETSVLMYMVHHFLVEEGLAPVDALHRAQLWMLDPDRTSPPGMPQELIPYCRGNRPADTSAWAAFTHLGR